MQAASLDPAVRKELAVDNASAMPKPFATVITAPKVEWLRCTQVSVTLHPVH